MGPSQRRDSIIYNETKALILQSLRDILTQEEWEKEKTRKTKVNCITVKDPLKNVQNKLKEQLLEEKRIAEKKLCAAKVTLKRARKRREEVGQKLDALGKKHEIHSASLDKASRLHQRVVSSHAKVKEALSIQQALHERAFQRKKLVAEKLEYAESEMDRLGKVLMHICRHWSGQTMVSSQQPKESSWKWNKTMSHPPWQ